MSDKFLEHTPTNRNKIEASPHVCNMVVHYVVQYAVGFANFVYFRDSSYSEHIGCSWISNFPS